MIDFWPGYILLVIVMLALLGLAYIAVLLIWAAGVEFGKGE